MDHQFPMRTRRAARRPRLRLATSAVLIALSGCGGPINAPRAEPIPAADPTKAPPALEPPEPSPQVLPQTETPPPTPKTTFPPPNVTPPFERTQKEGDGEWAPMSIAGGEPPVLWTTEIHPDKIKKFVAVALVAIDRQRVELELVAGTDEPASKNVPGDRRPGLIPPEHHKSLIAALNGGFKARHGEWGMRIGTDTFIPAKDGACTIAKSADGQVLIGPHEDLAAAAANAVWFRQTPPCLIANGEVHEKLQTDINIKKWGAAEDGKTEIRRSAVGVSKDGRTIFFAIGEWTTAQALTRALHLAGAHGAAQLDINYSFTRFTLYDHQDDGTLKASSPLLKELKFTQNGYIKSPAHRDFFYLRHR